MNPFRQMLKASGAQPALGTWILSANPVVAEAIGQAGFEWAVVDMEHAPADMAEVVQMLQALSSTRAVPVVRVPWNDAVAVKRTLDAGATTVMFPFVQNASEAARAVAATRYPPQGVRGIAGMSRASRFGTLPGYLRNANRMTGVIVQVETHEAVLQIESIAAVDGVDALFVGPGDLAASVGLIGEVTAPPVLDLMARAVAAARRAGRPIGTLGDTPEMVAQYRAMGFDFLALGSDLGLMMRAATQSIAALRTPTAEHVHTLAGGTRTQAAA
jgi:2-keto-3-deoxy-L-rhamnonate aldolase RhmA